MQEAILYADDGMIASTNPGCNQTTFEMLMGTFDWVGLKTNARKTGGMGCHPCQAAGVREDEAYTRRMTGTGRSYKKRQQEWVSCPESGKDLTRGSLYAHFQTKNIVAKESPGQKGSG